MLSEFFVAYQAPSPKSAAAPAVAPLTAAVISAKATTGAPPPPVQPSLRSGAPCDVGAQLHYPPKYATIIKAYSKGDNYYDDI